MHIMHPISDSARFVNEQINLSKKGVKNFKLKIVSEDDI